VDWEGLYKLRASLGYHGSHKFDAVNDNVLDFLQGKGVLTHQFKRGSYYPAGHGVGGAHVGPSYSVNGIRFSFAREKTGRDYLPWVTKFEGEAVGSVSLVKLL